MRGCGNDPRTELTDGDRWAVAEFRAYLAERKTTAGGTMDAKTLREAGEGALRYALGNAGWSEEQVTNGLATYRDSVAYELAELIRDACPDHRSADPVWTMCHCEAADLIDSEAQR
jgi:hypothetical protein